MARGDLTNMEWRIIEGLLPTERGRKSRPSHDNRQYLNGMLHVLRVGCPWRDMHERYGKWNSVYVRFRRWAEQGVWDALLETLVELGLTDDWQHMIDSTTVRGHSQAAGANVWPAPFASRILRCSDQSASTYAVSREHPVAKMDIRTSGATIREPATGAIFLPGLSRRRSTVRPSSRSFLQTSLGYACRSTQPIRYAAAG